MTFQQLLIRSRALPLIDSQTLRALGEEPRCLGVKLSRWVAQGKLLQLRRGLYILTDGLRAREPSTFYVANLLQRPSYVSLEAALSFHGMIPERVPLVQSVTTGRPRSFDTPLGGFQYRHVKQEWFFGYREVSVGDATALVAEPEKALLDIIYLSRGEWPRERLAELRLESLEQIDARRIARMSRSAGPRMRRIGRTLRRFIAESVAS